MNRILAGVSMSRSSKAIEFARESFHRSRNWYSDKLDSHPVLTKAVTTGIIAGSGDLLCQKGIQKEKTVHHHAPSEMAVMKPPAASAVGYDATRTMRFASLGTVFVAPTCHYWYNGLASWFPGTGLAQVTKRVVTDQLTWTPVFMVIWLGAMWTMEGFPVDKLTDRLRNEFPDVMKATWICWVPAQFATFYLCPLKYQVLATNMIELFWNAYLSYFTAGKSH